MLRTQQDCEITAGKWADRQKKALGSRNDSEREMAAKCQKVAERTIDIVLSAEGKSQGIAALAWAISLEIAEATQETRAACEADAVRVRKLMAESLETRIRAMVRDFVHEAK